MRSKLPVTVVIAAKNESAKIVACIDSVSWANEIIVSESGSSDNTAELAAGAGAIVVRSNAGTIGLQRNEAIAKATHTWILVVDADERGTMELYIAINQLLESGADAEAYRVPRRNFFLGKEIKYGGWDKDSPVRLFRSSLSYNTNKVHESVETINRPGKLKGALLHFPYDSFDQYFQKLNMYSSWWAEQQFERKRKAGISHLTLRPVSRFFSMYVLKLGILDGVPGLILALLAATSVFAKYVKLWGKWKGL